MKVCVVITENVIQLKNINAHFVQKNPIVKMYLINILRNIYQQDTIYFMKNKEIYYKLYVVVFCIKILMNSNKYIFLY